MKESFRWESNSNKDIPYFYPILPQIGSYIMHFKWEWRNGKGVERKGKQEEKIKKWR